MRRIKLNESQLRLIVEGGKKRYVVNLDVELPKGGRTAAKITPKEFEDKMKDLWEKYGETDRRFTFDNFVYTFCNNYKNEKPKELSTLLKDISKIDYDCENLGAIGKVETRKGVTYLKCYVGGDWECPVLFFIYWDGKRFRGYIPTYGNAFNRKLKRAFGNGDEEDVKFLKTQNLDCDDLYSIVRDISYDENSCLKDFLSRVELK
jgi:hypothetical protein